MVGVKARLVTDKELGPPWYKEIWNWETLIPILALVIAFIFTTILKIRRENERDSQIIESELKVVELKKAHDNLINENISLKEKLDAESRKNAAITIIK